MPIIARSLETAFTAAYLLICMGVFWPPHTYFAYAVIAPDASDPLGTATNAVVVLFLAVVGTARPDMMLRAMRRGWPLLLLVALAYVSAFWSEVPSLVLRRATTLAATTLLASYLAVRFDLGRLVALLVKLNLITVAGSFAVMAVAPRLGLSGISDYPDAWRGVFTAKNTLGVMSAFGIIVAIYAVRRGYGSRAVAALLIPANLLLLYLSQSATPRVMLIAAAYAAAMASALRRRDAAGFVAGYALAVIGLAALGLLAIEWRDLLAAMDRGPSLTGRLAIWHMAIAGIAHRPWLGAGYGAFWRHDNIDARTIWDALQWLVPHAHNVWLEIGLELGIVGMAGITLFWFAALYRSLRALQSPAAEHAVFCTAILAALLVESLTEYDFLRGDDFLWVLCALAFVHLGREAANAARQSPTRAALGAAIR